MTVGVTTKFVIRVKQSTMIHAVFVRCKKIEDEFFIELTTEWILGLGYPEVTI